MKNTLFLYLITLGLSCTQNTNAQNRIDANQTEKMLQIDSSIQLVDLRTPTELQQTGKIQGARHINFNSADFKTQIAQLDKEKPVIIYCAAGSRSGKALSQMAQMGFKQVYDYAGGMNDWKAKGKKTIPQ